MSATSSILLIVTKQPQIVLGKLLGMGKIVSLEKSSFNAFSSSNQYLAELPFISKPFTGYRFLFSGFNFNLLGIIPRSSASALKL